MTTKPTPRDVIAKWLDEWLGHGFPGEPEQAVGLLTAAGFTIVPTELVEEAARQLSIVSSDPYEDSSDLDLAARLRACVKP